MGRIGRRQFLIVAGALLGPSLQTEAQQAGKVYRIGYLAITQIATPAQQQIWDAFEQGMREFGWVEGKNIVIERRFSEGKPERHRVLASELVRLEVDVLIAVAAQATRAASEATTTIPIVSIGVQDPVRLGIVQSLARPGGNVTGLTLTAGLEIVGKQLELLKETVPEVSRVIILWNSANPMHQPILRDAEQVARALEVQLEAVAARSPEHLDDAFSTIIRKRPGALLVLADPMFFGQRTRLAEFAATNQLPAMYGFSGHPEAGGLMSYGASLVDLYRRMAGYVDAILKGARPGDLPMGQPTQFDLVINLKAAKALGLTIPVSIMLRAESVIE